MKERNFISALSNSISQKWMLILAGLFSLFVYLMLAWFFILPESIWSPDEGAKLLQMKSLDFSEGSVDLTIPYLGDQLDPDYKFALREHPKDLLTISNEPQLRLERLPLFPLITKPFFSALSFKGLYLLPALSGALIGFLSMLLIKPADRRFLMWILIIFASPVGIYSLLFWEHTLAVSLSLIAILFLLLSYRHYHRPSILFLYYSLAAFLFCFAAYLRLETLLLSGSFLTASFILKKERRGWLILTAGLLMFSLLPFTLLHERLFQGTLIPTNARYIFRPLDYLRSSGWVAIPDLLIGPGIDEAINPGWLGGLWAIAAITAVVHSIISPQTRATRNVQWISLTLCTLIAAWFLFHPTRYRAAHGLLFTTPWAIFGFTRTRQVWRIGDWRARIIILTSLLGLTSYSLVMLLFRGSSPHGGLEWGARFALGFYPLLAITTAWDWCNQHIIDIVLIISLSLLGIGFQARGLVTIRSDRQINAALNQAVINTPEEHIVSDLWWFFLNTAPIEPPKAIYTVRGFEELTEWVSLVGANGVSNFALVTLDRSLPWHLRTLRPDLGVQVLEIIQLDNIWFFRLEFPP